MGSGAFPAEFFATDSPFFLQQVFALMRTGSYPPPGLQTYGFSFKHHYGIQAFVALTSLLTNLKPHFVMFGAVEPLLVILTGIVIYDIARRLTGRNGELLALFQMKDWPAAQIDQFKRRVGITHLLIHKHFVHAAHIPLALVYENENYAVYRF